MCRSGGLAVSVGGCSCCAETRLGKWGEGRGGGASRLKSGPRIRRVMHFEVRRAGAGRPRSVTPHFPGQVERLLIIPRLGHFGDGQGMVGRLPVPDDDIAVAMADVAFGAVNGGAGVLGCFAPGCAGVQMWRWGAVWDPQSVAVRGIGNRDGYPGYGGKRPGLAGSERGQQGHWTWVCSGGTRPAGTSVPVGAGDSEQQRRLAGLPCADASR